MLSPSKSAAANDSPALVALKPIVTKLLLDNVVLEDLLSDTLAFPIKSILPFPLKSEMPVKVLSPEIIPVAKEKSDAMYALFASWFTNTPPPSPITSFLPSPFTSATKAWPAPFPVNEMGDWKEIVLPLLVLKKTKKPPVPSFPIITSDFPSLLTSPVVICLLPFKEVVKTAGVVENVKLEVVEVFKNTRKLPA